MKYAALVTVGSIASAGAAVVLVVAGVAWLGERVIRREVTRGLTEIEVTLEMEAEV